MFEWDKKYRFIFSDLGSGDKVGVNDVGIGVFKRKPYIGLTKEILQNSTDAPDDRLPKGTPVRVRFELIYIDRDDIPDADRLNYAIHKCYEYYPYGDDGEKLKIIRDAAEKYLGQAGKIPTLKISDYNTTGLRGVREEKGSNWSGLVRERSATNKNGFSSGSFGVGKFAPFTFSALRTVFYSTKTIDDEVAFQGKAILTTFKEDNKAKQNIVLFADETSDNYDAVLSVDDIAPVFRREEYGTDVFVLGFEKEKEIDWMKQSAFSVIEHFFYSIYNGNLEVEIAEEDELITINRDNLGKMIEEFSAYIEQKKEEDVSFQFTAPLYWRVISEAKTVIKKNFIFDGRSMGEYELHLLTGENITEKKVLEMRQAGMKIREDSSFRIPMNFAGIFIATGYGAETNDPKDNISSFLRKCENQAHDDWSADEYPDATKEEKEKARKIINQIHKIIYEAVEAEMPDYGEDSVDAFGLSEYLPNEESDDDQKEEKAFRDYRPLSFEIQSVKTGKHRRQADISMKTNGGAKHKGEKKEKRNSDKEKKHRDNKHGNGVRKVSEAAIYRVHTPYDATTDEYYISFVAGETAAEEMMIEVRVGSDDDSLSHAEIRSASIDGKILTIKNGMIAIGSIEKGTKNVIRVKLSEEGRKTLEVRAYAER